jgi:hypothetical protein
MEIALIIAMSILSGVIGYFIGCHRQLKEVNEMLKP